MKRRNFCKTLIGAAVAAALPASATRDILIHKGNSAGATWSHDGTGFVSHFAKCPRLYHYQKDMLRQMNFYQAGARIHMNVERGLGKTYLHKMNFSEIEARVLAALNTKQKQA